MKSLLLVRIRDALKVLFGRRLSAYEMVLARDGVFFEEPSGSKRYFIFENSVRVKMKGRKNGLEHRPWERELMFNMKGEIMHEWFYGECSIYGVCDYNERSFNPPGSWKGREDYREEYRESFR